MSQHPRRSYDFEWFSVRWAEGYGWTVERPDAVVIVPWAKRGQGQALWLARVVRPTVPQGSWEFPGGGIGEGETPEQAARRELAEECALSGGQARLHPQPIEMAAGMGSFRHHLVEIYDVEGAPRPQRSEGVVAVQRFAVDQLQSLIERGEILVGATLAALAVSVTREAG